MEPDALRTVARHVARLLVERRFKELEAASDGVNLSAAEMQEAVAEVGQVLVMPPEATWNDLDAVAIRNWPGAYNVTVDLWTARGRSDMVVELTLFSNDGKPVIEIDGIQAR